MRTREKALRLAKCDHARPRTRRRATDRLIWRPRLRARVSLMIRLQPPSWPLMAAVPVPPLCAELDARTVLSRELNAQRTTESLSVRMYFPLSFSRS